MNQKIEWMRASSRELGSHRLLIVGSDHVGRLYEDASDGVNVAQVLEDIEVRYNVHGALVAALESARDRLRDEGLFTFQEDAVLAGIRKGDADE